MRLPCSSLFVFAFVLLTSIPFACHGQQAREPKKITIGDDLELHYVERGEGEPIIFVHGLVGDYSVWLRQLDAFAREDFRAISYSRRYNHPNKNKSRENHSAIVECDDLAALIRGLKIKKAHIVGHSYGAYTALNLVLKHPELVRTVTLAEPPIASWLTDLPGDQSEAGKAQFNQLMNKGVAPAKAAFESGDEELALRTMLDCIADKPVYDNLPNFVKDRMKRNTRELKSLVFSKDIYPAVDREKVRRIAAPTLILSGEKTLATARLTDPELVRLIPKKFQKRVVLPDATHIMWVEHPVESRRAVLEFIRGI